LHESVKKTQAIRNMQNHWPQIPLPIIFTALQKKKKSNIEENVRTEVN